MNKIFYNNGAKKEAAPKIVNHPKGEDNIVEFSAKGGENILLESSDKVYGDCMDLLLHTRFIIAYISQMAIHIDDIASIACDLHELDDEQMDDIRCQYEDIIIPFFDSLNQILQDYQLDMEELDNDIHQLLGKTNNTRLDKYFDLEDCGDD